MSMDKFGNFLISTLKINPEINRNKMAANGYAWNGNNNTRYQPSLFLGNAWNMVISLTTKNWATPPVTAANLKPAAQTARRNRRWLQWCVRPQLRHNSKISNYNPQPKTAERTISASITMPPKRKARQSFLFCFRIIAPRPTKQMLAMKNGMFRANKNLISLMWPNDQKLSHRRTDARQTQRFPANRIAGRRLAPALG